MQIVLNKLLTNYDVLGNPNAKDTLLILHGWGRSIKDWYKVSEALKDDYKIILLDLPGFGNTEKPEDSFTIYDYAKFVEDFLDKIKVNKCILMGHSFGGRIGLILASKNSAVSRLILVDAAGIEDKQFSVRTKIFIARTIKNTLKRVLPKKTVNKIINTLGSSDYNNAKELREIFKTVVSQDLTHHLKDINVPTLVIWGEKDAELPMSHALKFKNEIKDSVLRVVWGGDHFPFVEKYDEFIQILKEEM